MVSINPNLLQDYNQFHQYVASCKNITPEYLSHLWALIYQSDQQNWYSKPMLWIGMYIALASLFCILAMVADLLHGLHNRKLWFPCNYFTLNAASLTVIAVVIKLPMDLTNLMPGLVDRTAKLGSLSFMCTIMANLLPSLATMDSKELVSNMIALGILVITLVVNVCIQIHTGVLSYVGRESDLSPDLIILGYLSYVEEFIATVFVVLLITLLIIYVCSSLAILKSKQMLESKYQMTHQTALKDLELLQPGRLSVEKLKQHVSNYWIMAGTGSPQFMTVCSATTSASGVICALSTALHVYNVASLFQLGMDDYQTNYKWSMLVILIIQFIGVILGTLAPISRCFASLSFKLSIKWIWSHIKVFKVESYWTQELYDWKKRSIPLQFSSRKRKIVIENLKILFLSICIVFQTTVVVACKMIMVIPLLFVICVSYCFRCWKWLKAMFSASGIVLVQNPEHQGKDRDLSRYVLQLQDDMEFAERTLKGISKSVNRLIQKAEKKQPNNLMKLLAGSRGFEGVEKFDSHHVPSLLSEEYLNCWSLPLVTLTTISLSFPDVSKNIVDGLLSGVSEGLVYVTLVEESLNGTDEHVCIHKVAKTLWLEVEVRHEWLGNKLPKHVNTCGQILQWLRDTAKHIVTEVESMDIGDSINDNSKYKSISANSMYRITETLLLSYHGNIDQVSQEELVVQLSSMIADIMAACLTNLPRVIAMKCHAREIEKREVSVQAAAQLLGETTQIINTLQDRELPSLNPDELAFIDKWHAYLKDTFP
ncbi:hypothetical protein L2E82_12844 [Cichorium intybus]|uniref:Uncharacterized protein n=1 Tax=Cichorium intybus TaxID=13427 RepID=A0ACB9GHZ1_CICIN|nr:hypothetical protein L2E82_12844 [Cichorium intybus]